jgi:hypothetical protein
MIDPTQMLAYQRLAETGLTAAELLSLPMDEYARVTGRLTPTQAALSAINAQEHQEPPAAPDTAFTETVEAPQGVDVASMTLAEYAQFRQEAGIGGREYGNGILGTHGSWADAAKAKAGRSAMAGNRNTIEPPRIEGRYLRHDDQLDQRPAHVRLSNAANLWQGR